MTFGQFLRITALNFRLFWSASVSGSAGPLQLPEPDESADSSTTAAQNELSNDTNEAPPSQSATAPEGQPLPGPSATADADAAVEAATVSEIDMEDEKDAGESENGPGRVDEAQADCATSAPALPDDLVQGELEIPKTDDPLAADIMVESHGQRLGLTQLIESLIFVSDEPVDAVQLAKALDVGLEAVETALLRLERLYETTARGVRLQVREGRCQMVTAPACAGAIEDFLNLDLTTKLSGPALETLAVVAYRQPVTRIQIEAVRGVDCAGVLRSMTQRGLLEEVGRLETVGRPILYGVTDQFMQHFGLTDLDELPPLETEEDDLLWAATQLAALEADEATAPNSPAEARAISAAPADDPDWPASEGGPEPSQ